MQNLTLAPLLPWRRAGVPPGRQETHPSQPRLSRLPEFPSGRRSHVDLLAVTRRRRLGWRGGCLAEVPDEGASRWVSGEAPPPACRRPASPCPHGASPWDVPRGTSPPLGPHLTPATSTYHWPIGSLVFESRASWGQSSVHNYDTREADKASAPFHPALALLGPGTDRSWRSGPARQAPTLPQRRSSSVGTATAGSACRHQPWRPHRPDQAPWPAPLPQPGCGATSAATSWPPGSSGFGADSPFWPHEYHDSGSELTDTYFPSLPAEVPVVTQSQTGTAWITQTGGLCPHRTRPHRDGLASKHLQPGELAFWGDSARGPQLPFPQKRPGAAPASWPIPA